VNNEIVFVNDDPYEKCDAITDAVKKMPDKILFVDFGVGMDDESILQVFEKHEGVGCLVFPGVSMFQKFKENGMKIHAFTAAKLTMTYSHECISNILNAAGVSTN
jgi:hypothetical protein